MVMSFWQRLGGGGALESQDRVSGFSKNSREKGLFSQSSTVRG